MTSNGEFIGSISSFPDCHEFHTRPDITLKSLRRVRLADLQESIEINFGDNMSPTNKAIARAAGYRVECSYTSYPNMKLDWADWYWWYDVSDNYGSLGRFATEQEAWGDCCKVNQLTTDH